MTTGRLEANSHTHPSHHAEKRVAQDRPNAPNSSKESKSSAPFSVRGR